MSESIYAPHNQHKLEAVRASEAADASSKVEEVVTKSSAQIGKADQQSKQQQFQAEEHEQNQEQEPFSPHPHLLKPLLHLSGVDPKMTDKELVVSVFEKVLPVRLKINRDVAENLSASGTVEFQTLDKAEKAYATVRPPFHLRINQDAAVKDPTPAAKPLLVKQLPPHTDDAMVYDMFRPYGPLFRAQCITTNPAGIYTGFKGMASVEYYNQSDAQRAQDEMHCVQMGDKTISVSVDTIQRKVSGERPTSSEFRASAAPFVPGKSMSASAPSFSPSTRNASSGSAASIYAANPSSPSANENGSAAMDGRLQYSNQAATYVDPCNLFIKNLDSELDSNHLFTHFRKFGRIISARVMRDSEGQSREFGFVSFQSPAEASQALAAMDGVKLGSKKITVRLHEPKTMRQEKLAARFGSGSDAASGEGSETNGSPADTPAFESREATSKVDKRQSRSYFKAGIPSNGDGLIDEDQLKSLSSVVRNELLAGEFSRRVQQLPSIKSSQVDDIVAELLKLKLLEAVDALNNPISLIQRVNDARDHLPQSPVQLPSALPSTANPTPSGLLGIPAQRSVSSSSSQADNASIMSAAPASSKERERLLKAVISVSSAGAPVEDITDMLASLPKKERALCLFNPDFLKQKVEDAREILDITDESGEDPNPLGAASSKNGSTHVSVGDKSSESAKAAATVHTLSTLAALPASEIIQLANSPSGQSSSGLPLPKQNPEVVKSTDEFIDSLAGKAPHDQKQKLGDQLFKKIRSFGVKGAPKITIHLLDTEDLRSLAHLMNSYEAVLKEKVNLKVAAGLNK